MMKNIQQGSVSAQHVCLFGVGALLRACYPQVVLALGREPDLICDNDPAKWGQSFFGKRCVAPDELGGREGLAVVITVRRYEEIHLQLADLGVGEIHVACFERGYDHIRVIKKLVTPAIAAGTSAAPLCSVRGKWTLVTGASRGIGRLIAEEMARLGSNIIAHSRSAEHMREVTSVCRALGVEVMTLAADLSSTASLKRMLNELETQTPPIDILFNNAGMSRPASGGAWTASTADLLAHYQVNTVAPIQICCRLIPLMIRRGFGRAIQISSTIQKRPAEVAYACSKEALNKFVYDMTPSLRGTGVSISLVCPGHVRSDMGGHDAPSALSSVIPGALLAAILPEDTNGRWFSAQDYAGMNLTEAARRARFYGHLES